MMWFNYRGWNGLATSSTTSVDGLDRGQKTSQGCLMNLSWYFEGLCLVGHCFEP